MQNRDMQCECENPQAHWHGGCFVECHDCRRKTGSPELCSSCLVIRDHKAEFEQHDFKDCHCPVCNMTRRQHASAQLTAVAVEAMNKPILLVNSTGPYEGKGTIAVKYDNDKARFDLIPPNALTELAQVYTMGAKKYADRNWEKGMMYGRLFGAALRHLFAFWCGEDKDKESGLHHLAHAAFSCLAIVEYSYTGKGTDDRPCP